MNWSDCEFIVDIPEDNPGVPVQTGWESVVFRNQDHECVIPGGADGPE